MRDVRDMEAFALSQSVLEQVYAERRRQVESEGWTPEHDASHRTGELAEAASCYAVKAAQHPNDFRFGPGQPPPNWPWAASWWKPGDRRRMLIKAAALIIAEIERSDRLVGQP